jgi:hypothetical protein
MQQTIVMNECMNRKKREILRILAQESRKMELRIESMAQEDLRGKMVFLEGSRVFADLLSGWKLWRKRT